MLKQQPCALVEDGMQSGKRSIQIRVWHKISEAQTAFYSC